MIPPIGQPSSAIAIAEYKSARSQRSPSTPMTTTNNATSSQPIAPGRRPARRAA